jgi:hypothetical protein
MKDAHRPFVATSKALSAESVGYYKLAIEEDGRSSLYRPEHWLAISCVNSKVRIFWQSFARALERGEQDQLVGRAINFWHRLPQRKSSSTTENPDTGPHLLTGNKNSRKSIGFELDVHTLQRLTCPSAHPNHPTIPLE